MVLQVSGGVLLDSLELRHPCTRVWIGKDDQNKFISYLFPLYLSYHPFVRSMQPLVLATESVTLGSEMNSE